MVSCTFRVYGRAAIGAVDPAAEPPQRTAGCVTAADAKPSAASPGSSVCSGTGTSTERRITVKNEGNSKVSIFLLGAMVGGIAALLLAPASGPVTRGKIKDSAADIYDHGSEEVRRTKDSVAAAAQDAGAKVRERGRKAADGALSGAGKVKDALS